MGLGIGCRRDTRSPGRRGGEGHEQGIQRVRRDRHRWGITRRALRRCARRGRTPGGGRGARAGGRGVLVLGVHPIEDPAAARRGGAGGARGARNGPGRRRGRAGLAGLRAFSNYSDAGQEKWLADNDITLLRGSGRLAGPGVVEVDGVRHTADHIVLANGADPFLPPVPGLDGLEGVWTNREATAMKAVPRRLLILGGGPVGVEMAQAVRRLGGEAVVIDHGERVLAREPAPLGECEISYLDAYLIQLYSGIIRILL